MVTLTKTPNRVSARDFPGMATATVRPGTRVVLDTFDGPIAARYEGQATEHTRGDVRTGHGDVWVTVTARTGGRYYPCGARLRVPANTVSLPSDVRRTRYRTWFTARPMLFTGPIIDPWNDHRRAARPVPAVPIRPDWIGAPIR